MKLELFFLQLVVVMQYFMIASSSHKSIITKSFRSWQRKYNITYQTNAEYMTAITNFKHTYMTTLRHQLKYYTNRSKFLMKMNKHACDVNNRTMQGMSVMDGNMKLSLKKRVQEVEMKLFNSPIFPKPPTSLDYRKMGLVTEVLDQGLHCASCYAYAATCGIEGQIAKRYGRLTALSAQNIIDCSRSYGNYGCTAGSIGNSFRYISKEGIANSKSYPNTMTTSKCKYNASMIATKISSFTTVTGNEEYIKSVLAAIGPLAVGMRGSLESFYYYGSGIYDDQKCNTYIDHAVCIVGYGTDNSTSPPTDYWIIKNSWSTDWGEDGYFRLKIGSNLCGISNYVLYPTL